MDLVLQIPPDERMAGSSVRTLPQCPSDSRLRAPHAPIVAFRGRVRYNHNAIVCNVVTGKARLHLDWRNIPGETADDALAQLQGVLDACLTEVKGGQGKLLLHSRDLRTYTSQRKVFPAVFPSFGLAADDPLVRRGQQVLSDALARPVDVIVWRFATDGGHLMAAGVPTIGFGPAEAHTLHTVRENVPLEMLVEGMLGYTALVMELGKE